MKIYRCSGENYEGVRCSFTSDRPKKLCPICGAAMVLDSELTRKFYQFKLDYFGQKHAASDNPDYQAKLKDLSKAIQATERGEYDARNLAKLTAEMKRIREYEERKRNE